MPRTVPYDYYPGFLPENIRLSDEHYIETSYSFLHYRSELEDGLTLGQASSMYRGTMLDVGPKGRVRIGDFTLVHGARIISDAEVTIGDYTLISWNVVIMDCYRLPWDIAARRVELTEVVERPGRVLHSYQKARPVSIGRNVWLGFDVCVLPGVSIGEGAIVGAKSVVADDVPDYAIVAGNPARVIRSIPVSERAV